MYEITLSRYWSTESTIFWSWEKENSWGESDGHNLGPLPRKSGWRHYVGVYSVTAVLLKQRNRDQSMGQLKHPESAEQGTRKERVAWERGDRSESGCAQGILGWAGVHMYRLKPYEICQKCCLQDWKWAFHKSIQQSRRPSLWKIRVSRQIDYW